MSVEFNAEEIDRLLGLLEDELDRRGVAAWIYVVGGAAIALSHQARRTTVDIDASLVPADLVLDAAATVGAAEGLPPGWLNNAASSWIPIAVATTPRRAPDTGVRVEIASARTLLAMKLVASRNRDLDDIVLLAEELDMHTATELADLVREQYGDDQLELVHGGYDDMLLWCQTLATQFWST